MLNSKKEKISFSPKIEMFIKEGTFSFKVPKMNEKQSDKLLEEIKTIKNLLVLSLQKAGVKGDLIAKALGVSQGRLSQMLATKKYKKKNGA